MYFTALACMRSLLETEILVILVLDIGRGNQQAELRVKQARLNSFGPITYVPFVC